MKVIVLGFFVLLCLLSCFGESFVLRDYLQGDWTVSYSAKVISKENRAFYETDLREFHITFDETNTTQFTLGNTLVTLDLFCYGDYRCSLTRKTLNQDDIFEEDNNMDERIEVILSHDPSIKKFIARAVTENSAFEILLNTAVSFQIFEYPFNNNGDRDVISYYAFRTSAGSEPGFFEKYKSILIFAGVMLLFQIIKAKLRGVETQENNDENKKED